MKKLRFPFNSKPRPEWVEVPFDIQDPDAGAFDVSIADLPVEKFKSLQFQLSTATTAYTIVQSEISVAEALAKGEGLAPLDEELSTALAVIQGSEEIKPQIKRLLSGYIQHLSQQRQASEAGEVPPQTFLDQLRKVAPSGGDTGYTVLAFAESYIGANTANTIQKVNESFEPALAESLSAMGRAREKIVALGIVNHRGLIGQLVDDAGLPLLDGDTNEQIEKEIPFVGASWVFNDKKRKGTGQETLDFYRSILPNNGLIVSLSEAVLLYQGGKVPTLDDIYSRVPQKAKPVEAPAPATPTPAEAPPVDIEGEVKRAHPDDEVAPLA